MRGALHYTLTQATRFNIAPGQSAPVLLGAAATRRLVSLRWGLLPRWRGHGGTRAPLVHAAPVEAVVATPLLRECFRNKRCLVLADGCFAWRELKQPIWFHPEPRRVVAFAGVFNTSDDDEVPSFAILTGPPHVTRVNDAMPIVIAPAHYDEWLDPDVSPDRAHDLLTHAPLDGWRADAVSTRVSSPSDDPRCIEPIGNPNQRELF